MTEGKDRVCKLCGRKLTKTVGDYGPVCRAKSQDPNYKPTKRTRTAKVQPVAPIVAPTDIFAEEKQATAEDIAEIQRQIAIAVADPNLVVYS